VTFEVPTPVTCQVPWQLRTSVQEEHAKDRGSAIPYKHILNPPIYTASCDPTQHPYQLLSLYQMHDGFQTWKITGMNFRILWLSYINPYPANVKNMVSSS